MRRLLLRKIEPVQSFSLTTSVANLARSFTPARSDGRHLQKESGDTENNGGDILSGRCKSGGLGQLSCIKTLGGRANRVDIQTRRCLWYHFLWNGEHIQKTTRQGNARVARDMKPPTARGWRKAKWALSSVSQHRRSGNSASGSQTVLKYDALKRPPTIAFYQEKLAHC